MFAREPLQLSGMRGRVLSKNVEDKSEIFVVIFIVVVCLCFYLGGLWLGILSIAVGIIALGWGKRHDGPFTAQ